MMKNHPFHMVTQSPWPLILSFNIMNLLISIILLFNKMSHNILLSMIMLMLTSYQWWRDIIRESTFQGHHSMMILKMMKFSMILFIMSELFFFISLFWTFFHNSISPSIEISSWPPKNIIPFNPYDIPLLNSLILISSGFTITWSHYSMLNNKLFMTKINLFMTIMLGLYFSMLQLYEYYEASFCYNDSTFGSTFFLITGFHGSHVNIGILFLLSCFIRMMMNHFSKIHHFHFEAASWYWHFVDIIWLFVYMSIYWWNF